MAALSVAALTADQRKALIGKLSTAAKALEVYDSESANPALVADTNVALAAAQLATLSTTELVIESGVKIVHAVTGSGTTGVTPTIVANAVTALVLS